MLDPTTCAILFAAAVILALVGWGAWANLALRDRSGAQPHSPPAEAVTMAPPLEADIFVPPADPDPAGDDAPEWVLERIMDERFEPVDLHTGDDDSAWL